MQIKDIKVGKQFILGLAIPMVFLIVLGAVSIMQNYKLHRQAEILYHHPLIVGRAVGMLRSDIYGLHRDMKDLATADNKDLSVEMDWIKWWKKDAAAHIDTINGYYLGPRDDVALLKQNFDSLIYVCNKTVEILVSGNKDEVFSRTKTSGIVTLWVEIVQKNLEVINKFSINKGDELHNQAESTFLSINKQFSLLTALILLVLLIVNFVLYQNIRKPLAVLTDAAKRFHKGDRNARSSYVSENEFGILSDSFNKLTEEALRVETMNVNAVFESSPVPMFVIDATTNIVMTNLAFTLMCGGSESDILQHRPGNALRCFHSYKDPRGCGFSKDCKFCNVRNGVEALIANGGSLKGAELELELTRNGETGKYWMNIGVEPFIMDGHERWCIAMQDVTELKLSQAKILRQITVIESINRIFQEAISSQSEGHLGQVCLAVAEEITGSKFGFLGEVSAVGLLDDISISNPGWKACEMDYTKPPKGLKIHGIYGRVIKDGKGFFTNNPNSHPDSIGLPTGHPPLESFLGVPLIRDGQTTGMIGVGNRDGGYNQEQLEILEAILPAIVEAFSRKRVEVALRLKNLVFDASIAANSVADISGIITEANDSFLRVWGYKGMNEVIGKPLTLFIDDPVEAMTILTVLNNTGEWEGDYTARKKDGSTFIAHGLATVVKDETGKTIGYQSAVIDITRRKQAENEIRLLNETLEERVEERTKQLEAKNKELSFHLREIEQFIYITSHDLSEPLLALSNFTGLIHEEYAGKLDEDGNKSIDFIHHSAIRMQLLLKGVLDYSLLGQDSVRSEINCNKVVSDVLSDLSGSINECNATITVQELPLVNGYATELKLLFWNLISNAIKFGKKDIRPLIKISYERQGNEWVFRIADNGIGIKVHDREKVFIIFKRMVKRDEYEGIGIGLAYCKKIVELHSGKIWVESNITGGSIFRFTIPI